MPQSCAIPFAFDLAGVAAGRADHRVPSRGLLETVDGSRWRPMATPAFDTTADCLRFVQQPIRRLSDDQVCGYEILARPFGRTDSAAREVCFAEIEDQHEITTVDIGALAAAGRLAGAVHTSDAQVAISCNCSIRSLGSSAWWRGLEHALETGGRGGALVVELTERGIPDHPDLLASAASALKKLGVQVSLDDVGDPDGQHVLALFEELRPDWVKLSGRLIAQAAQDQRQDASRAEAELTGYLARAHAVGASVVAEGVESQAARALCERLGVDAVQGFLLDKPVPVQ